MLEDSRHTLKPVAFVTHWFPKGKGTVGNKKKHEGTSVAVLLDLMQEGHDTKVAQLNGTVPDCIRDYSIPTNVPRNIANKEAPRKVDAISQHVSQMEK